MRVYWSKQELLIHFLRSGASCFQCCSCSFSSYCFISSCNCSQVLLEACMASAAAAFVTVVIGTSAATVAGGVLLAPCFFLRNFESVSHGQQPCCTHSPSSGIGFSYCHHRMTAGITLGQLLITVSTQNKLAILPREQQQQSLSSSSKQYFFFSYYRRIRTHKMAAPFF